MSSDLDAFYRYFVSLAEKIPHVQEVRLSSPDYAPRIWTIIRAEPFDFEKDYPVFEAELAARIAFPDVPIDFGLINLAEHDKPDLIVPQTSAVVLWRRAA